MTRSGPGGHRQGQPSTDEAPLVAIVDDDASVRQSARRLIRSFGYRAEAFASGEEFLASASAARTGCLVLDVRMPNMDGLEVQHEACGSRRGSGVQTLFPGGERLGAIPEGPDQTAGRLPNRSIIVDDGDERRFIGRWLALPMATRSGSRHGRNVPARRAIF